jgi:RNA polymerase sigma-70 factor (ECF subfamily)
MASLQEGEDRSLVEAFLRNRSEAAFRALYRRHTPRLYQLALRLAGWREEDACEIVQESWVRAVRKLPEFRWDSKLATWLTGIAVNRAFEVRRARPMALPLEGNAAENAAATAPAELRVDLERAIAGLPQGYRRVLVLHDVEGHTHAEIGALLGIGEGTSKSQLFEARKALRVKLGR